MWPVETFVLPSVMVPVAELDAMQVAMVLRPSAASMAGASTGQRSKGAQSPLSWVAAAAEPVESRALNAVNAASRPTRVRLETDLMSSPLSAAVARPRARS